MNKYSTPALCFFLEVRIFFALTASPLLFAISSLARYSAVFALHAKASVSSLLSVLPFRFLAFRTPVLWHLLTMILSCCDDSSDYPYLKLSSYTLVRAFTSSFLQIPPRGGHPCSWLTVGFRQPPSGTFTLVMAPMLGVHRKKRLSQKS